MERSKCLIDTNVVIDFLADKIPPSGKKLFSDILAKGPKISVITQIELLGYHLSENDYLLCSSFVNDCTIFQLTPDIVDLVISTRRNHKVRIPDAIIGITAIQYNLTLLTRNKKDFSRIEGLEVLNIYEA